MTTGFTATTGVAGAMVIGALDGVSVLLPAPQAVSMSREMMGKMFFILLLFSEG
jgi:hypothetical protein